MVSGAGWGGRGGESSVVHTKAEADFCSFSSSSTHNLAQLSVAKLVLKQDVFFCSKPTASPTL